MKKTLVTIAAVLVVIGLGVGIFILIRPKPVISKVIQKSTGFTIFVPRSGKSNWYLDKNAVKYDSNIGVLNTTLISPDKTNKLVMTQQSLPSPFTDIPNYSALFYGKLNEYQELNLPLGTVALTKPTELKGGQQAVANIRGTLMFLHPDHDLTDNDWKALFNNLESL